MEQYKVIATKYTESGGLTNDTIVLYYAAEEQAERAYIDYNAMHYKKEDGTDGRKMYQVKFYVVAYKLVEDTSNFFNMFKA